MSKNKRILPHINSYTRLQRSKIHGIGIFAILDIKKGTNCFCDGESKMILINKNEIENICPEHKKLYDDFCVIKEDKYLCPISFNNLTVGWYLNESDNPNVECTSDYDFIAIRDIKKGEELTVDYSTFDRFPVKD